MNRSCPVSITTPVNAYRKDVERTTARALHRNPDAHQPCDASRLPVNQNWWPIILCLAICNSPALADNSSTSTQVETPDGRELVEANCMQCHREDDPRYPNHTLGWVFGARYNLSGWVDNINRMEAIAIRDGYIEEGDWTDADKKAMADFLTEQTRPDLTPLDRLGHLHFSIVHFPIALVYVIGLFEVLGILFQWQMKRNLLHALWYLAAIAAAVAVAFGLCLIWHASSLSEDLADHRIAGFASLAALVAGIVCREIAITSGATWARLATMAALILAILSVGFAGHLGGRLVHGEFIPTMEEIREWRS